MVSLTTEIPTETWIHTNWDDYLQMLENLTRVEIKGYYYQGKMRIEMAPVGSDHADDHSMITFAVSLYATLKRIPFRARDNCTYRRTGTEDCQPDISYYSRDHAQVIPWGTNIVDLDRYPQPDLAIEISKTTLADDQGMKRLLYEDLDVSEYWIVDVENARIFAFAIRDRGSYRITESQVFPGLAISILEETLNRSRQMDQSLVGAWLLAQFQAQP